MNGDEEHAPVWTFLGKASFRSQLCAHIADAYLDEFDRHHATNPMDAVLDLKWNTKKRRKLFLRVGPFFDLVLHALCHPFPKLTPPPRPWDTPPPLHSPPGEGVPCCKIHGAKGAEESFSSSYTVVVLAESGLGFRAWSPGGQGGMLHILGTLSIGGGGGG